MTSNEFANAITNEEERDSTFRMATVNGKDSKGTKLTFYGESKAREKSYKRLASYSPAAGDTVICAKLNNSYVVLGKVVI